ncbi:kinase-like protein [Mycena sanguinolenta]|nr:kinase-like protein [Mycena sanguinolenta]
MVEEVSEREREPPFKWIRGQVIKKRTRGGVYLAINATTGEMLAVKQIGFPQLSGGELPGRPSARTLKRELDNMKALRHPNLVEYLGHEETDGVLSIFMPYFPGASIRETIRKYGVLPSDLVKSFTSQILDGLISLHASGLIHGALKPSNVLVEPTGICKIEGLCCAETELRDNSKAIPKAIFWTAPEVIRTQYEAYDSKVDIWSLGCIVLQMLTGKRPWFDTEAVAVMFKLYQQTLRPYPPDDLALDPAATDLMEKCLALKPEDRLSAVHLKRHPFFLPSTEHPFQGSGLAV